ncbi:hypothetical protein PSHT_04175, partial [Puccinia striiformis]
MAPQAQRILRQRLKKEADTQSQDQPADENSTAPGYPNPYNQPDAMGREPTGQSPNSHARGKSKVTSTGYHIKCKVCTSTLLTQPGIINVFTARTPDRTHPVMRSYSWMPQVRRCSGVWPQKDDRTPQESVQKDTALPKNRFLKDDSGKFDSDEDDMVGSRLDNNHENTAPTGAINVNIFLAVLIAIPIATLKKIIEGSSKLLRIRELNTKKEILCFTQERIGIDNSFRRLHDRTGLPNAGCQSLVGSYVSSTGDHGKFVIVEGPLLRSMKEGKWLVCQDIDHASDVSFIKCSAYLGKTSIVEALARLSGKKLQRINLSDQTDLLDLYGATRLSRRKSRTFERKDASFLDAFRKEIGFCLMN